MNDTLENLRRVIRLIEEMDAYFGRLPSLAGNPETGSASPDSSR